MNNTFDFGTLADDLREVSRIYTRFFATLDEASWDRPVKGGHKEWNLHETIAHLCALNGAGLNSIKHALRGEPYTFAGLHNRYQLNAYNRKGIDEHLGMSMKALCADFLDIHNEAASIARSLRADQADLTMVMPIYNRPVRLFEALSIIVFHAGLVHSAQVAEPAGVPPLWKQLSPEIRHRTIGRVMRAMSLLYRHDLGGNLTSVWAFRVDGPGGGRWHIDVSPETCTSDEGAVDDPSLTIHLRETAVLFQMITNRFNLPVALLTGRLRLRGDWRLFLQMNDLFSVDARPKVASKGKTLSIPQHLKGRLSK